MDQNFDSGLRFWAMAQRARNGPKFEKSNSSFSFRARIMQISECTRLTMLQNLLDQNFDFWPHLGFMGPPNGQKTKFFVQGRRSFKFSGFTLICPRKLSMKLFFELGAPLWSPRAPEVLKYQILCRFLFVVVEDSNFQDLPFITLINYQ